MFSRLQARAHVCGLSLMVLYFLKYQDPLPQTSVKGYREQLYHLQISVT